jgi:putative inorganic carbon (HCO3(-)) transporter
MVIAEALLVIAWGVFAFGAVYPWAYWPLFAATAVIGIVHIFARSPVGTNTNVVRAFALIAAAMAIQLVPLPQAVIAFVSPATDALLRQHDLAYAGNPSTWHALSIDPKLTRIGLAAFVALAMLSIGLARALGRASVTALAFGIAGIGLVLAVFGLIQRSTGTLKIYGFWSPVHHPYQIYGPFVNRNHFAGWMIMAIPLAIGVAFAAIASAGKAKRTDWRNRILWLASPDGNRFAWATFCVFAMGVALMLTLSRSGIAVFFVTMGIVAVVLMRRLRAGGRRAARTLAVSIIAVVALGVLAWTGLEPIVNRFATGQSISGRLPGWTGAIRIARAFPVTGSGINTYRTAMLYYSTRAPDGPYWDTAHDDYLQVAAEGGLLVVIPVVIAIVVVAREIRRRLREDHDDRVYWIRAGAAIGMIAIALQELVDFSLQIPGNAVLLAVLCAIAIHVPWQPRRLWQPGHTE